MSLTPTDADKLLADMYEAHVKLCLYAPRPPSEYRIHPDDYDKLREILRSGTPYECTATGINLFGLKVVLDPTAERIKWPC